MGAPEAFTRTTDVGHWIGGQPNAGSGGRSQAVYNPATGQVARQVLLGSVDDVNAAVAAASAAFPAWADLQGLHARFPRCVVFFHPADPLVLLQIVCFQPLYFEFEVVGTTAWASAHV